MIRRITISLFIIIIAKVAHCQQITEFSYRIRTHSSVREPDSIVAILEKVSNGKYYFRIVPKTRYHHTMRRHNCLCTPNIYIGDTVIYDTYPDIHLGIRQTYIYRTVRRFKR